MIHDIPKQENNRPRPTLEQIYEEYGFDGEKPETEEVDWGGFVGEEVPL
jgi:hypothetical protein